MLLYRDVNERYRLRFECDTDGKSESFKANRNQVMIVTSLLESTGFGAGYKYVEELDTYVFPARAYSYSKLNHVAESSLKAYREQRKLPGQVQKEKALADAARAAEAAPLVTPLVAARTRR